MAYDTNKLIALANCLYCNIPAGKVPAVEAYLLEQWVGCLVPTPTTPPAQAFSYEPATAIIQWTDKNGVNQIGNLAYFYSKADIGSVSDITSGDNNLISFSGLSSLPSLLTVNIADLGPSGVLDVSNCQLLTTVQGAFGALKWANCPSLSYFNLENAGLYYFIFSGPTYSPLNNVDVFGNNLITSEVNKIFQLCVLGGATGGTIDTSGQIPPAPPTGPGLVAKAALLAETPAWNVTTD